VTDTEFASHSIIERAMHCRAEAARAVREAQQTRDAVLRESHLLFARGWTKLADYYEAHKHAHGDQYLRLIEDAPQSVAFASALRAQNER
jgi:hypothetical protein